MDNYLRISICIFHDIDNGSGNVPDRRKTSQADAQAVWRKMDFNFRNPAINSSVHSFNVCHYVYSQSESRKKKKKNGKRGRRKMDRKLVLN